MSLTRAERLASALRMPPLLAYILSYLISWRTLALVLAALNLKSLPFAWHIRLFILAVKHGRPLPKNLSFLRSNPASKPTRSRQSSSITDPSTSTSTSEIHPIFRPVTITSRTSLYETDYNLHKSNSTYFADLDHSRTALVASLLTPALVHSTLAAYGEKPGALYPILGAVHTSFLREIKPLEAYSVRSRLLGWDRKWLVIVSYFVRPATKAEKKKKAGARARRADNNNDVGGEEVLLACALNKYVVKKGRKTIEPGLALAGCGWFRAREGITHNVVAAAAAKAAEQVSAADANSSRSFGGLDESAVVVPNDPTSTNTSPNTNTNTNTQDELPTSSTPGSGQDTPLPHPSQTSVQTAETVSKVVRRLSSAAADSQRDSIVSNTNRGLNSEGGDGDDDLEEGGYTWSAINAERLRGLEIAEKWLGLDISLREEYEQALLRGVS